MPKQLPKETPTVREIRQALFNKIEQDAPMSLESLTSLYNRLKEEKAGETK